MSFKKEEESLISKRFVSENELEEIKKKREEEWEIARNQGRKIEKEEDVAYDGRTLYERLKEQKDKKQEEFEEQLKFKNMIYKGLDEEDASFLTNISKQKSELHNRRFNDESAELLSYRAAVENIKEEESNVTASSTISNTNSKQTTKIRKNSSRSQSSLLSGVIIRKRPTESQVEENKQPKQLKNEEFKEKGVEVKPTATVSRAEDNKETTENLRESTLGGLIAYSDTDSSDNDT